MNLPYYMSCSEMGVDLYQLKDGRFQMIKQGKIAPLMVGFEYALVERRFAEYLERLDLPHLEIEGATIYDPKDKVEIDTHHELRVGEYFSASMIRNLNLDGERLFLMDKRYLFVSPQLKERLENTEFKYLRFTEGLSGFA